MIYEALVLICLCLVLTWLGLGLSVTLMARGERRLMYAVAAAPTVGLGIVTLLGFPLYRFVAPMQVLSVPLALGIGMLSTALLGWDWSRHRAEYTNLFRQRRYLLLGFAYVALLCVLAAPLVFRNIQYVIFRSNPSDAFFYMSLSESVRTVPWDILQRGIALTADNFDNLRQLDALSPTALMFARALAGPHPLGKLVAEAWAAQLFGVPVYRINFASNLLAPALTFPLALALGDSLRLSRWLKYLGAVCIAFGFWLRVPIEYDAGYEVMLAPFVLLVILAWIILESESPRWLSTARVLLALAVAFALAIYVPPLSILILGGMIYYALGLWQRTVPYQNLLFQLVTLALAFGILGITLQLDFLAQSWYFFISIVESEQQFISPGYYLLTAEQTSPWRAFWGMPETILAGWTDGLPRFVVRRVADLIAFGVSLCLLAALTLGWRKSALRAERLLLSMTAAVLLLMVFFFARGLYSAVGRELSYGFSFLAFGLLIAANHALTSRRTWIARGVPALVAIWMAIEIVLGLGLPFTNVNIIPRVDQPQVYDLSPLTQYLNQNPPRLLLVAVPKTDDWQFAAYVMHVLQPYPTYYQSGVVVDNSNTTPAWWFGELQQPPDYALILRDEDYIGKQQWGSPVASTRDLILYKLSTDDVAALNASEKTFRARDGK